MNKNSVFRFFLLIFMMAPMFVFCQYMDAKDAYFSLLKSGRKFNQNWGFYDFIIGCEIDGSYIDSVYSILSNEDSFLERYGIERFKDDILRYCVAIDGDWTLAAETDDYKIEWWINTRKLHVSKDNSKVSVWEKAVYYDNERDEKINLLRNSNEIKWSLFKYSLSCYEYDLSSEKFRILSISYYTKYGDIINTKNFMGQDWDYVIPDSYGESIFNVIKRCVKQK